MGLALVVLAYQAVRTALALQDARELTGTLRTQLADGDLSAADATARALGERARVAHDHSDGLGWDALAAVPWLGDDVQAVQTLAAALDGSVAVLPQTLEVAREVQGSGLRTADGALDLDRIQELQQPVDRMARALSAADRQVSGLSRPHLPPLADAADTALQQLGDAAAYARAADTAIGLVPDLLGADGPRTYLLLVQNNAEIRATGGLLGPLSVLDVRDGRIRLTDQRDFLDLDPDQAPVGPVDAEEEALYGRSIFSDLRDMTATPDFPSVAQRVRALVARETGQRVDGVVSVDPVALAQLLAVTGPVEVRGEQLTGENAVPVLLNQTYDRFRVNDQQDAFFAASAKAIFEAMTTRPITPDVVTTLTEAVSQRRVLLWSAEPQVQEQLAGRPVSGALPHQRDRQPQVGLYLNDSTSGKLEYYLRYQAAVRSTSCSASGVQRMRAQMVLRSTVPPGGRGLPPTILAIPGYAPPGVMRLSLAVYAPDGGTVLRVLANGTELRMPTREHDGRPVGTATLLLKPGQEIRIDADLEGPAGATGGPRVEWTPSIEWGPTSAVAPTTCS